MLGTGLLSVVGHCKCRRRFTLFAAPSQNKMEDLNAEQQYLNLGLLLFPSCVHTAKMMEFGSESLQDSDLNPPPLQNSRSGLESDPRLTLQYRHILIDCKLFGTGTVFNTFEQCLVQWVLNLS